MIKIVKVDRLVSIQAGHPVPTALYQKITGENFFTWVDALQQEHTHKRCVFFAASWVEEHKF